MSKKLQKLIALNHLIDSASTIKKQLLDELTVAATDDVIFMRRFRMLRQVAALESQLIEKIYQFQTDENQDYATAITVINNELKLVTSRSA